jgi:hypothetical protein
MAEVEQYDLVEVDEFKTGALEGAICIALTGKQFSALCYGDIFKLDQTVNGYIVPLKMFVTLSKYEQKVWEIGFDLHEPTMQEKENIMQFFRRNDVVLGESSDGNGYRGIVLGREEKVDDATKAGDGTEATRIELAISETPLQDEMKKMYKVKVDMVVLPNCEDDTVAGEHMRTYAKLMCEQMTIGMPMLDYVSGRISQQVAAERLLRLETIKDQIDDLTTRILDEMVECPACGKIKGDASNHAEDCTYA